jgi:hypothetical protein
MPSTSPTCFFDPPLAFECPCGFELLVFLVISSPVESDPRSEDVCDNRVTQSQDDPFGRALTIFDKQFSLELDRENHARNCTTRTNAQTSSRPNAAPGATIASRRMNPTLVKAAIALIPAVTLVVYSAALLAKKPSVAAGLQLSGAIFLLVVVSTHIAEALRVFRSMGWGQPNSVGHYIDLASATLGGILLVLAFAIRAFRH